MYLVIVVNFSYYVNFYLIGVTKEEFDGESDHLHLLIQYPHKWSISVIVNTLKSKSSRMLRKNFPNVKERYYGKAGLWHRSYFAGSVGGTTLDTVKIRAIN